jgi:hypothetical protein
LLSGLRFILENILFLSSYLSMLFLLISIK